MPTFALPDLARRLRLTASLPGSYEMPTTTAPGRSQARMILFGAALLLTAGDGHSSKLWTFSWAGHAGPAGSRHPISRSRWRSRTSSGASRRRWSGRPRTASVLRATMMAGAAIYVAGLGVTGGRAGCDRVDRYGRTDRHRLVVHGDIFGHDRMRPRRFGGAPQHHARHGVRGRIARHADCAAHHPGLSWRISRGRSARCFSCCWRSRCCPAAFCGWRRGQDTGQRTSNDVDARGAWPGDAQPAVPRDVRRLFRLRPQSHVPDHAPAGLSRVLRPGPDAERGRACRDRRRELDRVIADRLAGRTISEAHPAGPALHAALDHVREPISCCLPRPASTLLFAAAMGLLRWPGLAPLIGGMVAEIFGTRYMATLLGISFVVHQMGSSLGAFGGGLIFDLFGSYDRAMADPVR